MEVRTLPKGRDYPGLVEITFPTGKTISCVGSGPEVEAAIREHEAKERLTGDPS